MTASNALGDSSVPTSPSKSPDRRKPPADEKTPKKGHGPTEQLGLERVVVECKLDVPDRMCPSCGGALVEMLGQFETSEIVDVVEVQYRVIEARRHKYRCACGACVDTALSGEQVPERNIEGGRYSVGLATKVVIDKYVHHLPLERQVRMMAEHGLVVTSRSCARTNPRWCWGA